MILSKYTFHTAIPGSDSSLLINYLSGSVDILEKEEVAVFENFKNSGKWTEHPDFDQLRDRGYLFTDSTEEAELVNEKYLEFSEEYEKTPVQLIFSTSFSCNLSCVYCFQESYHGSNARLNPEISDKFFSYINRKFSDEPVKPYITLFGGEPLLAGHSYRDALRYFLEQTAKYGYSVSIVTNGFELESYVPILKETGVSIREIQVTVDGDAAMHDSRRPAHGGKPTFEKIMGGIDLALKNSYRINLRSIIDKQNLGSLANLARYCKDRGFLDYPSSKFETSLGRNYELHTCQDGNKLFSRLEMWQEFAKEAEKNDILKEFHRPSFHGMRHLSENGSLPMPIFDACPAGKKEWAFDVKGFVYGCTASVGVEKYILDSYITPGFRKNPKQLMEWQTRDVLAMDQCRECPVNLSCGGGCGVLACNENGSIHSPNCRPVKELAALGASYFGIH